MVWSSRIMYDCQVFGEGPVRVVSGVMKQLVVHMLVPGNPSIHLLVLLLCHVLLLKSWRIRALSLFFLLRLIPMEQAFSFHPQIIS